MADLNRRNFLFGTVAAAAAGTALTLVGKDVELFKPTLNEIVSVNRVPQDLLRQDKAYRIEPCMPGDTLYNDRGQPVCVVMHMAVQHSVYDATSWGDLDVRYVGGPLKQILMEVEPVNKYL